MKWYTNEDFPYGKEPIVVRVGKQIYVGHHQTIHNSSIKHMYKDEERWVLTTTQQKIKWSDVKEWHYVRKIIDVIDRKL